MKNETNIKIPNKYKNRVKELYYDEDGYWCYLNRGWHSGDFGCHTIHEDTQKRVLEEIRWSEHCDCNYCKGLED